MPCRLFNGPGFAMHVFDFPHRNAMSEQAGFPAIGGVPKPDARVFLFQRLLLQIKAAQGGHFKLLASRLPGQQWSKSFVDPTGLNHSNHTQGSSFTL